MFGQLSSPLTLSGSFDEDISVAYDYFQNAINNRSKRPALFDKEIYIEANENIDDKPVGFWHVVSIEESHHFEVLPCVNDGSINLCDQNCVTKQHQVLIKHETERRNICLLRASRLPWIVDIIKLANKGDPSVKTWLKPSPGKLSGKLYLRYNHDGADYVLIFSAERHFYRLISAFPVFYRKQKAEFDKDYSEYAWFYFKQ